MNTPGQQFAATLRDLRRIGPCTRRYRAYPGRGRGQEEVIQSMLDTVADTVCHEIYSDAENGVLRCGWGAVCSWEKHVEGGRINPSQRSYLQSLTPWQFVALLGEMTDAGVTNTCHGERWLEGRRDADIAAWVARGNA